MKPVPHAQILHGGAQRQPVRWLNVETPPMTISRYRVAPGDKVSLHVHTGKAEYWVVVAGRGVVSIGAQELTVQVGDVVLTPPQVPHALLNTGTDPLEFVNLVQPVGNVPITTTELEQGP